MRQYFGKYRGKVEDNQDPMQMGRLQVSVPAVLGDGKSSWALPCVPFAGPQVGFFALPPKRANVWVEFEGGDPDYPIWTGCFWGAGEVPATPATEETKIIKTKAITMTLSDAKGFTLEVMPPAAAGQLKLALNQEGITLSNGKSTVKLTIASVSINDGALEVI